MPAGLGSCTALTSLRLHENLLEELPTTIGACTLLQDLRLFNNNLLHLPLEVGNMCYLPALRVSSNQLGELTIGVGGLDACCDFLAAENYIVGDLVLNINPLAFASLRDGIDLV